MRSSRDRGCSGDKMNEKKTVKDFIQDLKTHCEDEIQGCKALIAKGVKPEYYRGMKEAYKIVLKKISTLEGEEDA
jgi:hypothetical protein